MRSCNRLELVGLLHVALHRQRRIKRAFRHLHLLQRGIKIVFRRRHQRVRRGRNPDRARQVARRKPVNRRTRRQLARLNPDHLPVGRNRGLVGRLRAQHLRAPGRQPRFRLRDVGARHLADIEAVARLAQLFLQHLDVAPLQVEDRRVTQQVHVRGHRREQHRLLGHPQGLARCLHLALRLARAVGSLKAVVERLRCRHAKAARRHVARQLRVGRPQRRRARRRIRILRAHRAVECHPRPVTRQRLRHPFIGRTHRSALRIERRIVLIGQYQSPIERVGMGRQEHRRQARACDRADRKSTRPSCRSPTRHPHVPSITQPVSPRFAPRNRQQ